jgi:hypothetical protein
MKRLLGWAVVGAVLASEGRLIAQPGNDAFANAWVLTGSAVTTNGVSTGASKEAGEPNHAGNQGGRSVWFRWTAPASGQIRVDTSGSGFNTLLAVYIGNAVTALTPIVSNNDGPGLTGGASLVEFQAVQGTAYRIVVDAARNFFTPAGGPYVLTLRTLASVAITSPINNATFTIGTPITLTVGGTVPVPPIQRVDFYRGGGLFGSDSQAPFSAVASNSPAGSNGFQVVAVDSSGARWTSAVVNVAVLNVGVTLFSPPDGSLYLNTDPIAVSALVQLPVGSITNVDFFVDGQKFGQDSVPPFAASWAGVTGGSHRLTAVGTSDSGATYMSQAINIGVAQSLVLSNSVWKYLDNGSDQGTAWSAPDFDDEAWASGAAELGYGDGDEATVVADNGTPGYTQTDTDRYITTYFRRAFNVPDPAAFVSLHFALERDDAGVVYLNGREIFRSPNLPAAPTQIAFTTVATGQGIEDTVDTFTASPTNLVRGVNVIAVEIHQQAPTSSDISFNLELTGLPALIRNQSPLVHLTAPTNREPFVAPATLTLAAAATDPDGAVTNVEFFVDGQKLGEATEEPYEFIWQNPTLGEHVLNAVATDDQGASSTSSSILIAVYDAFGTPLARLTSPADGAMMEGPTNLLVSASASAYAGLASVQFRVNGSVAAEVTSPPYAFLWNAPFGTNVLEAAAFDLDGVEGVSAPVRVVITVPPTNTVAPTVASRVPAASASVTNLSSVQVIFSEWVVGVNAGDLRVNGVPATGVSGSSSNYTFTFPQPAFGLVTITWAPEHGITDLGYPSNLPFDETAPGASWTYNLIDRLAPTLTGRVPAPNSLLTNLTQVSVTFSEPVIGIDAFDLLVNGTAALTLNGSGSNYTFSFSQPAAGTVTISWAAAHGITDLSSSPNSFNALAAGATWNYTLDDRTILVQSNATWRLVKGTAEASVPSDAWRATAYNDSGWSNAPAPFYYGDPYNSAANPGTLLTDMQAGAYTTIYLRRQFTIPNVSLVTNLLLTAQVDDGFIAWINGVEVARVNAPAGEVPFNGVAPTTATEPNNNGAAYLNYTLPEPSGYLREGENVLAVHGLNQSTTSTDFGFNAQLYTYLADPRAVAPRIASITPAPGSVFALTNVTVRFTEAVSGVDADDLQINGQPADGVTASAANLYTFTFAQPPFGPVNVHWAVGAAIMDFDEPPKPFDGAAAGAIFQYTLLNPSAPVVASQTPLAGATVNHLTEVSVMFNEPVSGVDVSDLLLNGVPATGLTGGPLFYTFSFAQPAFGPVSVGWAANHNITDLEPEANVFDAVRAGSFWAYTLVDQTAPTIVEKSPPAGTQVLNLTSLTVTFSEAVSGMNAADLLINGAPATGVSGGPVVYTFTFPQPNATVVNVTWANAHGIRDLAVVPNNFDGSGAGSVWSYSTLDNVAPALAVLSPPAGATIRSLAQVTVVFSEAVVGVGTNDLLMNNRPAIQVAGSGAGPYTFNFVPPSNGLVEVHWASDHAIVDLASPPNEFDGGEWTYILDPHASFAGSVLINEIMFNPAGGRRDHEWIELYNVSSSAVNLAGWRFSRGVDFVFPTVSIPVGGFVVVAANVGAFQTNYPGVNNVIGGWTGQLANSEETIALETALGEEVNAVHYATDGDWGRRERGHGAARVVSIVPGANNATVTIFNHGYTAADTVLISGAEQPEYNGRFSIGNIQPSSFTIPVSGGPGRGTGNIICRQIVDNGASGWSWFSAADGFGSSLELINPAQDNQLGQNWLVSVSGGGTPGRANSVRATNAAPFVLNVTHSPALPRSSEPVAVTARVRDERSNGVAAVTLFYRNHTGTPGNFLTAPMRDDGRSADGVASDGLYGAILPAATNGAVIEFYVQALDIDGLSRTWPAAAWETNNTFGQLANAYYQVSDEVISNTMPVVRVILSGTERAIYQGIDRQSDAEQNITFISTDGSGTEIRYGGGVRVRGAGSRTRNPPNNRINLPNDQPWEGRTALNLNGQFVHAQLMGAAVARKSGLPASDAHVVQYRMNGNNPAPINAPGNGSGNGAGYGTFLMVSPVNGELAEDLFPEDPDGNVYRASTGGHSANFSYQGTNASSYVGIGYFKTSNQTENDWNDLINLSFAFSQLNDADFMQAVSTNLNVLMWMRYFAVGSLVNFGETSLFNGRGDDYAMYRGLRDPRFVLIGHDFDTIFGQGDTLNSYPVLTNSSPFIMMNPPNNGAGGSAPNVPLIRRLMTNAAYVPFFYSELKRLADTVFSPEQLKPLFDELLAGWGPTTTTIDDMKNYAAVRRGHILSQIPLTLTVSQTLSVSNGVPLTTAGSVLLYGTSHAIETRRVLVNGVAATYSAWEARWTNFVTLHPGLNRVLVQSFDSNNVEFARVTQDVWAERGPGPSVSGTLNSDTTWLATSGPYLVTGNLTVNPGITLTIAPGTTVFLAPDVNVTVANGGRIRAEGTEQATIFFARAPGGGNWGGITIHGGAGSPESRFAYVHFNNNNATAIHGNGADVFVDHVSFGNPAAQYLSFDGCSFVIQDSVLPNATAGFEPIHGTQGIKPGGRGIIQRNFIGRPTGYNDSIDFTGGNRPGPILQVLGNVFAGSDDDILDLDSTDAWVEGNIFLHCHRNGSPDSSSAISGGADNADTSQITIVGNIFYDVDQVANAKQGNFYTLLNNTVVHQTRVGSQDTNTALVILADEGTAQGAGVYLEGNIFYDIEALVRNQTTALVTFTNNLMPLAWTGPGGGNFNAEPLFQHLPQLAETTNFTSLSAARVMWQWLSLRAGSPAAGVGPNGRALGAGISRGVSISGEPPAITPETLARLSVGFNRTGSGIPVAGFPEGSGFTHYRWRFDGGVWSSELPISTPLVLSNLSSGPHSVEVSGRNDAGFYQDDPIFGPDARVSVSGTWNVNPSATPLLLSEILAANGGAFVHQGTTPDAIELYNSSGDPLDLAGVRLTDDPANPNKFIFPAGATIPARGYLVVLADNPNGTPGFHLGFNLAQEGDGVFLYNAVGNGGALLDSVVFGLQLRDLSLGRQSDGSWALALPTLGAPNRLAPLGDPRALRINEWLALGTTPFDTDFVELYNTDSLPVAMGGLFLSDELVGHPQRHAIAPLSFLAGFGYQRFLADGNAAAGAEHLNFKLSAGQGELGLFLPDLVSIDCVYYLPQWLNVSSGRSPNGGAAIVAFTTPTPGAPNPVVTGPPPFGGALVLNEVLANNTSLLEQNRTPDWVELYNGSTNAINLDGLSLTDDSQLPRRFVFSAANLGPGGRLRIRFDDNVAATNDNTGFALKSSGGSVYLFDRPASGGALLNAITYGLQTPDLSIARVPDGSTNWVLALPTPDAPNLAVPAFGNPTALRVNEWMANPLEGDDWIEIYNPNSQPVALGGLWLTDNLGNRQKHRIAPLSFLGTGTNAWQKFVADNNTGAGADHAGFRLDATAEDVGISAADGTLIDGYAYGAQGPGVSQGRFPDGSTNIVKFPGTESPGDSNWRRLVEVVLSEVLTHTDEPLEDAIELQNLSEVSVDVGGWWLSDDNSTLRKYQIPSPTVVPAGGFVVIYEAAFTNAELAAIPFALSSQGDEVVLSAATGGALNGYRTRVDFGPQANGVAFGRFVTSDNREEFVAMAARTFGVDDPGNVVEFRTGTGRTNAYPRVGPVVISEIMYHPPDLGTNDNVSDEFIELRNITTVPVPLYDPLFPANVWHLRNAVEFDFPLGTVLAPGATLLVVSFDPVNNTGALSDFRARYGLGLDAPIVGPYRGKLANDTDDIELRRPDTPNLGEVPYILVERVRYTDGLPWPSGADGGGFSLQRLDDARFGNDPGNWLAAGPTPGPVAATFDTDHDGLPDSWELANGFDRLSPLDAGLDTDRDGLTNLQEYQGGSDPRDPRSGVSLTKLSRSTQSGGLVLEFTAFANQSYTIETADAVTGSWEPWQDVAPAPAIHQVELALAEFEPAPLASGAGGRFFRLRTPWRFAPSSLLRLTSVQVVPGPATRLEFSVTANQACTVEFSAGLNPPQWSALTNLPAGPARTWQLNFPGAGASGFFRLRTP